MLKPQAYGYVHAGSCPNDEPFATTWQDLSAYADHEGFTLSEVFVEDERRHTSAFAELMDAIKVNEIRYVIIPSPRHLAFLSGVRGAIRARLNAEGVNLCVMLDGVEIPPR